MADELSQATAENPAPAGGDQPPQASNPKPEPQPEEILAGDNVESIKALMRQNDDALVGRNREEAWTGFEDDSNPGRAETPPAAPDPDAAATPGEGEGAAAAGETEQPAPAAAETTPPAEPAKPTKPEKDIDRVRINRFNEADQAVLRRMATKDGLTFDQAKAELVDEGKLPAPEASATANPPPTPKDEAAEAITAQEGVITDLEKQIKDAAKAFDSEKVADLSIAHNKALRDLAKLERQAEGRQQQQQAQAQQTHTEQVHASEADAIDMFPDAGKPGSALHEAIRVLMAKAPAAAFQDPDYPVAFAAKAAAGIGYKPGAAPAKTPPVVPKKPARPVPVAPASGNTAPAGASATKGPTLEARIATAEKTGDVETLRGLLREHGTHTLD